MTTDLFDNHRCRGYSCHFCIIIYYTYKYGQQEKGHTYNLSKCQRIIPLIIRVQVLDKDWVSVDYLSWDTTSGNDKLLSIDSLVLYRRL